MDMNHDVPCMGQKNTPRASSYRSHGSAPLTVHVLDLQYVEETRTLSVAHLTPERNNLVLYSTACKRFSGACMPLITAGSRVGQYDLHGGR